MAAGSGSLLPSLRSPFPSDICSAHPRLRLQADPPTMLVLAVVRSMIPFAAFAIPLPIVSAPIIVMVSIAVSSVPIVGLRPTAFVRLLRLLLRLGSALGRYPRILARRGVSFDPISQDSGYIDDCQPRRRWSRKSTTPHNGSSANRRWRGWSRWPQHQFWVADVKNGARAGRCARLRSQKKISEVRGLVAKLFF
jgi:hypothetical protein